MSKAQLQPSKSQLSKPPLCKQAYDACPDIIKMVERRWNGIDVFLGHCAMLACGNRAELFLEGMRAYLGTTVTYWEMGKTRQEVIEAVRAAMEVGR